MTVYLDVIFLYNFLIDWILLWSTAYVLKLRPRWYRISLGAGLGAGYTVILFFPYLSGFFTFFAKLCLSIMMVWSVFGYHRLLVFMRRLLCFYLVAFILGGGLLGVNYFLQTESEIMSGIVLTQGDGFGTPVTWGFIAIGFPLIWWFSGRGIKQLKETNKKASYYVDLDVSLFNQTVCCRGLIDTGNQLYEPITRIPVTIMDLELYRECIPSILYESVKNQTDFSSSSALMELDDQWLQRVRMIPYRSVSRGMDLLLALRPDHVRITLDGRVYETRRVLIGLNPVPLASDGSYQAIVHPQLTEEESCVSNNEKAAIS